MALPTAAQVAANFKHFKTRWLGGRVDYDGVYRYQCADLIKQYVHEYYDLKPGSWGNAIDYWYDTANPLLTKFSKVKTKTVKPGDIVVFEKNQSPIRPGAQPGHIAIATGKQDGSTVEVLEQNGSTGNGDGTGGNRIRTRDIAKSRIAGVLRPKTRVPAPAKPKLPANGSVIEFKDRRSIFYPGTTAKAGTITGRYIKRGVDSKYPGRMLLNSAKYGNNLAVALYDRAGKRMPNWIVK